MKAPLVRLVVMVLILVGAARAACAEGGAHWHQGDNELRAMVEFDDAIVFDRAQAPELTAARDGATPIARAAAIYALAASDVPGALTVLESLYGKVSGHEQIAAIFGLAELEPLPLATLLDSSRLGDMRLAAHLGVALTLTGDAAAQQALERYDVPGTAVGDAIASARRFASERTVRATDAALRDYLRIRREAAMRHGRVGGEPWLARRVRELQADEPWLVDLIVPIGAAVDRPWTRDHLLEALLADPRPVVHRACVDYLGAPLVDLVTSEIWVPRDAATWHALLDAIEASAAPTGFAALVTRATQSGVDLDVRRRAACVLFAMGLAERSDAVVRAMLESSDVDERALALRAVADSTTVESPEFFEPFLSDEDPRLRAIAIVAMLERAPGSAGDRVREGLLGDPALCGPLVAEMARRVDVSSIASALSVAVNLPGIDPVSLQLARAALLERGIGGSSGELLASLAIVDEGPSAARAIGALYTSVPLLAVPLALDVLLYGTEHEITVAAARVLVLARHPIGLALVRRALWIDDFTTTQLAAGHLIDQEGLAALLREIDAPLADVDEPALRRLGLALGEWGGYGEVQRLARSRSLRDPVLQGAYLGALAARTR